MLNKDKTIFPNYLVATAKEEDNIIVHYFTIIRLEHNENYYLHNLSLSRVIHSYDPQELFDAIEELNVMAYQALILTKVDTEMIDMQDNKLFILDMDTRTEYQRIRYNAQNK